MQIAGTVLATGLLHGLEHVLHGHTSDSFTPVGKTAKYVTVSYSCTKLIQLKYTLLVGMHKFL